MKRQLLLLAVLAGCSPAGFAHDVQPGFLQLRQTSPGVYNLLWKKPIDSSADSSVVPVLPRECRLVTAGQQEDFAPGAAVVRGTLQCNGGIEGKTLAIAGLDATTNEVIVHVYHANSHTNGNVNGELESHVLTPENPSVRLGDRTTGWQHAQAYLGLGIQHILTGTDHLLFVLGILLIVADWRMLLKTITSFTLAHSITLAIATLGYASAPLAPVDAAIGLSIFFLGPEIVRKWRGQTSFTIRHPWVVAFAFGLLHGFGFASGLTTIGMPRAEIPQALLLFNAGVEIGQLFFVLIIVLLQRAFRALEIRWPKVVEAVPGYVVGSLGAFWTIQRTVMMLGGLR
jgi:hydrogenase/urease accessory protein HupE